MQIKLAILVPFGLAVLAAVAISQDAPRAASAGVFTVEQAKRGQTSFEGGCAMCHGEELDGTESAPSLSGDEFTLTWGGHNIGDLIDRMQKTMPADQPGKLSRETYTDIAAYILSVNKYPAGTTELPSNAESLKQISIDSVKTAK